MIEQEITHWCLDLYGRTEPMKDLSHSYERTILLLNDICDLMIAFCYVSSNRFSVHTFLDRLVLVPNFQIGFPDHQCRQQQVLYNLSLQLHCL